MVRKIKTKLENTFLMQVKQYLQNNGCPNKHASPLEFRHSMWEDNSHTTSINPYSRIPTYIIIGGSSEFSKGKSI